jgi:hypothetical protein
MPQSFPKHLVTLPQSGNAGLQSTLFGFFLKPVIARQRLLGRAASSAGQSLTQAAFQPGT